MRRTTIRNQPETTTIDDRVIRTERSCQTVGFSAKLYIPNAPVQAVSLEAVMAQSRALRRDNGDQMIAAERLAEAAAHS